jgi:hypothetical protein
MCAVHGVLALFMVAGALAAAASGCWSRADDCTLNAVACGTTSATGGTSGGSALKGAGEPCDNANQCSSTLCQGGFCCSGPCPDQGAGSCGTDGMCAAGTGACQKYAAGSACSEMSCSGSTLTTNTKCDGNGNCAQGMTTEACPSNLSCNTAMTNCNTACGTASMMDDANCASGYYCDNVAPGACQPKKSTGTCTADDQCMTGPCSSMTGYCCKTGCATAGMCITTGCDINGDCMYPVTCGTASCTNNLTTMTSTESAVGSCSDMGTCNSTSTPCGYFMCNGTACSTTCTSGTQCWTGLCEDGGNGKPKVCCNTSSCSPYACTPAGTCTITCTSNADCSANHQCMSGVCM